MENFIEFENSNIFKISSLALAVFNILFFFSHIYLINKLNKNKNNIEKVLTETSCLSIIFQLISSSLFFLLLNKIYIQNTKFLSISYLIGIVISFEWYSIYIYYYHNGNIIKMLINFLIPFFILSPILFFFFFIDSFNIKFELLLKHISFIFYLFMFISPGLNIFKLIKTKNPNYIMILNSISGIFLNIGMILFIISLNYYNIEKLYFIIYPSISLLICLFEVFYYTCQIKKGNYYNKKFLDDFKNDDSSDSGLKHRNISLVNRNSIEDD